MSRLFISHSSRNNAEALALRTWLDRNGWGQDEVFLDLDPVRGLVAGERWQARLKEAANRCEAVLFVISTDWVASRWCGAEFLLAKTLGKKIFGIIVHPTPLDTLPVELTAEFQLVDLSREGGSATFDVALPPDDRHATVRFHAAGLANLKAGLARAGLDARSFPFNPERPIFRGLKALEKEDAAIFFGRNSRIIEGLDRLRSLVARGGSTFLVLLGASGSGKSSFLRAGLVPRLERDDRRFLTLPVLRPSQAALTGETGLVEALHQGAMDLGRPHLTRAEIERRLKEPTGLGPLLAKLQKAATERLHNPSARAPLPVLPIDQGEELFEADAGGEARQLLDMIAPLARQGSLLVLMCMRSDSFERLQQSPSLLATGIDVDVFSLPPMPPHGFKEIVEGPVERLRAAKGESAIDFDPALTDRLLADIGTRNADALPLLAFVLERQLRRHDRLTLAGYEETGGLSGAIVDAVAESFRNPRSEPAIPEDPTQRAHLLRRAFIPWLARIDEETGETRRRVARLSEIPAEAHPLIERLVQVRLLVKHQPLSEGRPDPHAPVEVEPAHEALLRQWPALAGWLEEEHTSLLSLEGLLRAASDWHDNNRTPDYLSHKGSRLADAKALAAREDYRAKLEGLPRTYLDAAIKAERAQAIRRQRLQLSVGALMVLVIAGLVAYINEQALSRYWFYLRFVDAKSSEELAARKPGESFLDCGDITGEPGTSRTGYSAQCPEMVIIPAGSFMMGSPEDEPGRSDDEGPQHKVTVEQRFAVSRFEITAEQWRHCVRLGGCENGTGSGEGLEPVSSVSWQDAQAYVAWLSTMTGQGYRLLTEAEWEYAARAGTTGPFFWNPPEHSCHYGNGADVSAKKVWPDWDSSTCDDANVRAAKVGSYLANNFGLHDTAGNVWELVQDCYSDRYIPDPAAQVDHKSQPCLQKVLRGGSWFDRPKTLRSSHRSQTHYTVRNNDYGFRVARAQ